MELRELSYTTSREFLDKFQRKEQSYGMDWYNVEEENTQFIWVLENIVDPIGFLSYKVYKLPESHEFLYIVKVYVLNTHCGEEPELIEGERVSQILFRQIESKGVRMLTLESANEDLDEYYKKKGFEYNAEISRMYASVIGTKNRKIIFKNNGR